MMTMSLCGYGSAAAADDLPIAPIEWSRFISSPDTRIIYVSSSEGDDATAKPNSAEHPFRTIRAAMRFVQDGYPDWIVLKCGDVFEDGWGGADRWTTSGRSAEAPILIGPYGEGPRPVVPIVETDYGPKGRDRFFSNVAFYGLRFTGGVDIRTGGENIIFEDCYFDHCQLTIQGLGPDEHRPHLRNVVIRRCIFDNNWSREGRPQGLYAHLIDGLTVQGCFFWRGGWNPDVPGADATILNHNVYIHHSTRNVVFRGNISADASSHGAQLRSGGVCEGNLFIRNPIGLQIGAKQNKRYPEVSASGVVRYNAILDSRDIAEHPRGHGLWIDNAGPLEVHHLIIAHQRHGSEGVAVNISAAHHDLHLRDIVIYDWRPRERHPPVDGERPGSRTSGRAGHAFVLNGDSRGANVIEDVIAIMPGDRLIIGDADRARWRIEPLDTTAELRDPQRDIESYMRTLGVEGGLDAFVERCLQQRKRNWNDDFTARAVLEYLFEGFEPR